MARWLLCWTVQFGERADTKGGALRDMRISETEELKGANEGIDRKRRRIQRVQFFKIRRNYTYGHMGVCVARKHHLPSFVSDLAHSTLTF